jgi:Abnormal spindle-like microcephaly-assoc'd, ASPM-SPD-2-Hydin
MEKIKTIVTAFLIFTLFSCSENATEISIRDMVFNQNNSGTGNTLPKTNVLTFDPSSIDFGMVQNGTNNSRIITISNAHKAPVNITVSHTNSITQINLSITNFEIPANGTYQFTIVFSPTATMFLNDTLSFSYPANVTNSTGSIIQNVNLTGNSVATLPTTLSVTPTGTIDFGNVLVGQTVTRNITLLNTGSASASWTPVGTILSFDPSGGNIPVGNSQIVAMSITANAPGVYSNTQTFSYNGGTVQVPYTVNRIAATRVIGVSCTTSTDFGNVPVNTTITKTITISNSGNSNLTVSQITTSQVPNGQFTCSYSGVIPPNGSVNVPISFKPTVTGSKTCTINVQSDKTAGTISLSFTGNSVATLQAALSVNPTGTIDFGTVIAGQTATKNITLNNTGSASATWTPIGNILSFNPVGGTINPGSSQIVAMSITATGTGVYNNTQSFSYNGGTVQVSYTANRIAATRIIDVSSTTSTAFGNVSINTTVSKTIKISNTGNSNITVSQITTSQIPNGQYTCSYSGTIAPNTSVNVTISFKPTATGSKACTINVQSDKTGGNSSLNFTGFGI